MTRNTLLAAAILSLAIAAAPVTAHANPAARFELRNTSGQPIHEIHVVPAGTPGLGEDLLGDRVLSPGRAVTVTPGGSGCRYNVEVVYRDTTHEWFRNIDLCTTTRISFANTKDFTQE